MRIAVLGSKGLLGSELLRELTGGNLEVRGFSRDDLDFSGSNVIELIRRFEAFDAVINAAAFTNVLEAEKNSEAAFSINANFPKNLALACKEIGSTLAQISTDYVFSGNIKEPYSISSARDPINVYGESKALGERFVQDSGAKFTIFRTSWLYGAEGKCFPKSVIAKLSDKSEVRVVNDQIGQPTWTKDVAHLVINSLRSEIEAPIVHASASGKASWYDFAVEIAISKGFEKTQIVEIETESLLESVNRPKYSVLDVNHQIFKIGDWKERWRQAADFFS